MPFHYQVKLRDRNNQIVQINGYQPHGRRGKKEAERIARDELRDERFTAATVFDAKGKKLITVNS